MRFSLVVPVYNEAENILPLIEEISAVLSARFDYEIIYVNDGSDDGSAAQLRQAQARFLRLRVLHHRQRCGQSAALLSGVRAARAPLIVTLDGDGQNDPADIEALMQQYAQAGEDRLMLVGHRTQRRDNRLRRWSSRVANAVRRRLLHDGTPDTGCGLKLFPRRLFLDLPAFDHMHRFLPALAQRAGARVVSVPVNHRQRRRGRSKYGINNRLWVGLVDLAGVAWLQKRRMGKASPAASVPVGLVDVLGVRWLQHRPCVAALEEEY